MSTWIFLRGLARESRHWGDFPNMFRRHIPEARIHAPDLPGNGNRYAEPSPTTVEEMAEACRRKVMEEGIAGPYRLFASSLGAMVAVAWATGHPDEVGGCVLINTSLRPYNPFYHRLRPGSYLTLASLMLQGSSAEAREVGVLRLTTRLVQPSSSVLKDWIAYRRQYPVSSGNTLRQLLAAARFRAPRRPPCPVLILAGRGDALVHPLCSRRLAAHWGADFAEHPSAGHDLPLDDGPWVAEQVRRWLGRATLP